MSKLWAFVYFHVENFSYKLFMSLKFGHVIRFVLVLLESFSTYFYSKTFMDKMELTHYSLETPKMDNWQTLQTQIRCCRMRCLIRDSTVCKWFAHFLLGMSKSHGQTYLKLKLDSSNIQLTLVISTSLISNNHLSRSENLVPA